MLLLWLTVCSRASMMLTQLVNAILKCIMQDSKCAMQTNSRIQLLPKAMGKHRCQSHTNPTQA